MRHVLTIAGFLLLTLPSWAQQRKTLDDCDAAVRTNPNDYRVYACYQNAVDATWDGIAQRLEAHLLFNPENYYAMANLATVEFRRGRERASELSNRAARGLAEQGNTIGATFEYLTLSFHLGERGRLDEARQAADNAMPLAESLGNPVLLARVLTRQANLANLSEDYGRSLRLLARTEADIFPAGPVDLKSQWLSARAYAFWALGRLPETLELYRREAALLREQGNAFAEAVPRRNIGFLAGLLDLPGEQRRRLVREALEIARRGKNEAVEASAHTDMVSLAEGAERMEHARRALELERSLGNRTGTQAALLALADALFDSDPDAAFRALEEATELARRAGEPSNLARAAVTDARLRWRMGPRESAIEAYRAAFDAIEATRNLQPDDTVRAMRFGTWGRPYSELISHLLSEPQSDEDLEIAFSVAERRRARMLLDRLDAARATAEVAPDGELAARRSEILHEISRVQRTLVEARLSGEQIDAALEELERLELEEGEARDQLARASPSFAALYQPVFPGLLEIRAALPDDQALLYYHVTPLERAVGSWLIAITHREVRTYSLPDSTTLGRAVHLFLGLFGARDGAERVAATRLYDRYVRQALDDLPPGIDRLVIVPHHSLNLVPFGALRAAPDALPLASRYEMSMVPSATLWLNWTRAGANVATLPALALVDPALPVADVPADSDIERNSVLIDAARLGSLAQARREGRAVVERLGAGSVSLEGDEATESHVKHSTLSAYGVIHFAAHALIDDTNPERSAIVLAPGSDEEDGLLQIREIVELDLSGQVVVLSACRSAYGRLLGNEGVMDLARAFFQAGASTVVGSLWPLRDEEAAEVFEEFYRELGRGQSVAAAMASAQREQLRSGAPSAAWAGLVVLGNGDVVPHPGDGNASPGFVWMAALAAALGVAAYAVIRLRRSSPGIRPASSTSRR